MPRIEFGDKFIRRKVNTDANGKLFVRLKGHKWEVEFSYMYPIYDSPKLSHIKREAYKIIGVYKEEADTMLVSNRGIALVTQSAKEPYLTVENTDKWYSLYLINLDGSISEVPFTSLEADLNDTAYGDHCVNPLAFVNCADRYHLNYDEATMNIVIDRWLIMYLDGEVSKILSYIPEGHKYITCLDFVRKEETQMGMLDNCPRDRQTVGMLVNDVDAKRSVLSDIKQGLMTLHPIKFPMHKNDTEWMSHIRKDERIGIKILLAEYDRVQTELDNLLDTEVTLCE